MIYDVCRCVAKRRISVVSKRHDSSIRYVMWKEVFEPEGIRLVVCPGVLRVSVQAMDRNDTRQKTLVYWYGLGAAK